MTMEAAKEIESHIRNIANLSRENEQLRRQVVELKERFKKYGNAGLKALEEIELALFTESTGGTFPLNQEKEKK